MILAALILTSTSIEPAPDHFAIGSARKEILFYQARISDFSSLVARAKARLKLEKGAVLDSKDVTVAVDPRVNLLSIIFRLAGNDEFESNQLSAYAQFVDGQFKPFSNHPAVAFARKLRAERQISGDAVASFAIHLSEDFRAPDSFEGLRTAQWWRETDAKEFAPLVRSFAQESDYKSFLDRAKPIHDLAETRINKLVNGFVNLGWYDSYFGKRPEARFRVAVSLLQGAISFGISMSRKPKGEELYAVMGTWSVDGDGLPTFGAHDAGPVLVHEFLHSYIDPAVGRHLDMFRPLAAPLQTAFAKHLPQMAMFYWRTLFEESLIRAAVVRYLHVHHGSSQAKREAIAQMGKGFVWTDDLAALLAQFEGDRSKFRSLEDFFPAVANYFSKLPDNLPEMVENLDARRPVVTHTSPAGGATNVDPELSEIKVFFDRKMNPNGFGTLPPIQTGAELPEITRESFDNSGRVLTLRVRLKERTSYELRLNSDFATGYQTEEGIPLKGFRLHFRTR